jgi:succinate-acetate transporter protein
MAKTIALIFGIIYTLVGVAGFLTPLGGTFGMTPIPMFGVFYINLVHNIVHLVIGIPGLLMAGTEESAARYLRVFGIILVVVAVIGFIRAIEATIHGFIPIGGSDVWLHLGSGLIMLWGASTAGKPAQAS